MKSSLLVFSAALLTMVLSVSAAPPRRTPVMMEKMTTTEIRDAIKDGKTTVLIFNASTEASGPALALGQCIAIGLGQRCWLDRDRFPRGPQLIGDDLRQGRPHALPSLGLGDGDGDPAIARDLDEIAERLLVRAHSEVAARVAWPDGESDDQADARAPADQHGPPVELQRAYCAFSDWRSILPVPRRGRGSAEKMKRAGILNFASRSSRKPWSSS